MSTSHRFWFLALWFWSLASISSCGRSDPITGIKNTAPRISLNVPESAVAGDVIRVEALVVDPESDSITIHWNELPNGARVASNENESPSIVIWTPKVTQTGEFSFSVEVTDDGKPPRKSEAEKTMHVEQADPVLGNRGFQLQRSLHELALGDINGDGIIDIVALCPEFDALRIFLGGHDSGKGNGTFVDFAYTSLVPHNEFVNTIYHTFSRRLAVGDLNGDGADDVIVTLVVIVDGQKRNGSFFVPGSREWIAGTELQSVLSSFQVGQCGRTHENGRLAQDCLQFLSIDSNSDGRDEALVAAVLYDEHGYNIGVELWALTLRSTDQPEFETTSAHSIPFQNMEGHAEGGRIVILASEMNCFESCVISPQTWMIDDGGLTKIREWSVDPIDSALPLFIGRLGEEAILVGLFRRSQGILGAEIDSEEEEDLTDVDLMLPSEFWTWDTSDGYFRSTHGIDLAVAWSPSMGLGDENLSEDGELSIFSLKGAVGGISFEPIITIASEDGPHSVKSADFNGDGLDDLAYTLRVTGELLVWLNPGDI